MFTYDTFFSVKAKRIFVYDPVFKTLKQCPCITIKSSEISLETWTTDYDSQP